MSFSSMKRLLTLAENFRMKTWTLLALLLPFYALAQHAPHEKSFPHFRIAALIGHTHVPAIEDKASMFIPSWGLDLEYWFNDAWAIGMHNDIELQTFLIQRDAEETLERDYPIVLTLDAIYRPWKGLVFQLGPGIELEKTEDFFLIRAGAEYEFELGHHWDLCPMLFYDNRFNANDTWTIALGVGKRF
jgi:hypothetical protein